MSTTPVVHLELRISPRLFEKIRNAFNFKSELTSPLSPTSVTPPPTRGGIALSIPLSMSLVNTCQMSCTSWNTQGLGGNWFIKKQKSKISWHYPFNNPRIKTCIWMKLCPTQNVSGWHYLWSLNGTGSRDRINFILQKGIVLGINKTSSGFWISKMFLWWAIGFAILPAVKVKMYLRNNNYWRFLQTHYLSLSHVVLQWPHLIQTP